MQLTRRGALNLVQERLGDCKRCGLSKTRKNIVFGFGDPSTPLLFLGEGPGDDEDAQGEPFVGKAGQLLTKIIEAMGWTRETVYICNVTKCQTPGNAYPDKAHVEKCFPFAKDQIRVIRPAVIVTLGNLATKTLLGIEDGIMSVRGKWREWEEIPVMPTFHPSFCLRQPSAKGPVWKDMQEVIRKLYVMSIPPPFPVKRVRSRR